MDIRMRRYYSLMKIVFRSKYVYDQEYQKEMAIKREVKFADKAEHIYHT